MCMSYSNTEENKVKQNCVIYPIMDISFPEEFLQGGLTPEEI